MVMILWFCYSVFKSPQIGKDFVLFRQTDDNAVEWEYILCCSAHPFCRSSACQSPSEERLYFIVGGLNRVRSWPPSIRIRISNKNYKELILSIVVVFCIKLFSGRRILENCRHSAIFTAQVQAVRKQRWSWHFLYSPPLLTPCLNRTTMSTQ